MVKGRVEVLDISDVYTLTMATVMSIRWQGQRDAGVIILTSCWKFEHDVPDWLHTQSPLSSTVILEWCSKVTKLLLQLVVIGHLIYQSRETNCL